MRFCLIALFTAIVSPLTVLGQTAEEVVAGNQQNPPELVVALRIAPPFVMEGASGAYEGLSVDAFEEAAEQLGWSWRYSPTDLDDALAGTQAGRYDLAVGAFTVTAERERNLDFSHPFHTSGLGIAARAESGGGWLNLAGRFLSLEFLSVALSLGILLLAFGSLVWLFERHANPDEFGGSVDRGIGSGFWWAAVTMTTVGYGDKSPRTLGGRLVALVWMFAAIIVISSFTAAITSSLTVSQLSSTIESADDLKQIRTGTVTDSASETWLDAKNLRKRSFASLEDALEAVEQGNIEAVVYDAPLLRFRLRENDYDNVRLLPETVERQDYALVLPQGSPRREALNRALLDTLARPTWSDTVDRYLGP